MSSLQLLGISAGREDKVTEKAVKNVLKASGLPFEFYSLASFNIYTCDACNGCVESHKCVKDDKLNEIFQAMQKSAGIVFGAPEYWNGMNAKGRAFLERVCFSGRHNNHFPLADKPGVIVGVSGDGDSRAVIKDGERFFEDARINIVETIQIQGEYACFTCGYGHECDVGGLKNFYDLPVDSSRVKKPELCRQKPEDKNSSVLPELREAGRKLAE